MDMVKWGRADGKEPQELLRVVEFATPEEGQV